MPQQDTYNNSAGRCTRCTEGNSHWKPDVHGIINSSANVHLVMCNNKNKTRRPNADVTSLMKEHHHDCPSHKTTLWKNWRKTIKRETSLMKEHHHDCPSHKTTLWKDWRKTTKRWRDLYNEGTPSRLYIHPSRPLCERTHERRSNVRPP